MKNILITMSRNKGVIVPAVTLMSIGIGISGYYIQDKQMAARERDVQEQQQQREQTQQIDPNNEIAISNDASGDQGGDDESEKATKIVDIEITSKYKAGDENVVIKATIPTDRPGECIVYLKQGNYGPDETVELSDGVCEVSLATPGSGEWTIEVQFTSQDAKTRGDAKLSIEL